MSVSNNSKNPLIKFLAVAAGVSAASFIAVGGTLYHLVLSKDGLKSELVNNVIKGNHKKHPLNDYRQSLEDDIEKGALWFDGQPRDKISITNRDGMTLHGYMIYPEKESDIFVVCIHGYNSSPRKMGIYAKKFSELGYNVLLPSLRGHADSEDEFVTMGWKDRLDVIDWLSWLTDENPECRIILHGVSMGAATTMMATGEILPNNVKLAIEDCGYTTVWDILSYKMKKSMKLPEFPFLYTADSINRYTEDFGFREASCVEQVKKSVTPTLFIHGEKDDFVPFEMLDIVYNAAACEKEKLAIPDAPHARSVCAHPDVYWKAITDFINKYI